MRNFSAISWQEQVTFNEIMIFTLNKTNTLGLIFIASSLKQQSAGRYENVVSAISLTIISSGIFRNRLLPLRGLGSPSRDFLFISSVTNLERFRIPVPLPYEIDTGTLWPIANIASKTFPIMITEKITNYCHIKFFLLIVPKRGWHLWGS
jgi:hypothetical protein